MSREQQIEEMAEDLVSCHAEFGHEDEIYTDYQATAKLLIEKGYRKQSGWISVDERLPNIFTKVLCYFKYKSYTVIREVTYAWRGSWIHRDGNVITHWMPLPEPPKMESEDKP